jgi:hypothetical protein
MDQENAPDAKSEPKKAKSSPQTESAAAPSAPAAPTAPTATPNEWAAKLGLVKLADPQLPQTVTVYNWKHAAADKLYGWSEHAYHYQGAEHAFRLTEEDYRKALEAAAQYPCTEPHAPALPESQAKRFEGFVPSASRKESV